MAQAARPQCNTFVGRLGESQAATGQFDGFFIPPGEGALPAPLQSRQIEFIGDSYTVGSGNTSTSHTCTPDQLWATTDTAKAFAPQVARHYDAEYRINAYSGRGVVRNYDGVVPEAPLPVLYPYALFDGKSEAMAAEWHPQVILIALGTNDFSTPVHAGEKWADLATLRADYIVSYVAFIQKLREHNPAAQILLMAYDDPEVTADIEEVATEVRANGDTRVDTIDAAGPLAKTGCDGHPSTDDDVKIAGVIEAYIDSYPTI
jgi:lysophospholipase L1-like esterase